MHRGVEFFADGGVGFTEVLQPFGVGQFDVAAAGFAEHGRGNFSSPAAAGIPVHVLAAYGHGGVGERCASGVERSEWRQDEEVEGAEVAPGAPGGQCFGVA